MTFKRAWEVEPGIPIPHRKPSAARDAADKMQEGDSVLCDTENEAVLIRHHLNRRGFKTTSRKIAGKGWRIWRLKST